MWRPAGDLQLSGRRNATHKSNPLAIESPLRMYVHALQTSPEPHWSLRLAFHFEILLQLNGCGCHSFPHIVLLLPTEPDITSQHRREGISLLRETIHCEKGFDNSGVGGRDTLVLEDHARGSTVGIAGWSGDEMEYSVEQVGHEGLGLPVNTLGSSGMYCRKQGPPQPGRRHPGPLHPLAQTAQWQPHLSSPP
jgi:hypothetical protein